MTGTNTVSARLGIGSEMASTPHETCGVLGACGWVLAEVWVLLDDDVACVGESFATHLGDAFSFGALA